MLPKQYGVKIILSFMKTCEAQHRCHNDLSLRQGERHGHHFDPERPRPKAALQEIDKLLAVRKLTEEQSRRLDALTILVDAYEEKAFPMGGLDPVDLIKAYMSNSGRTQKDLADLIGPALASLILSRQRALSLEAIRKISTAWGIPADLLIRPYEVTARRA